MTKKTKNINKILITSRLTGTLAMSALVSTADLVVAPPEDDINMGVLRVCSEYFNILQVAEKVLNTDLDGDGEVGSIQSNHRPIASNRPTGSTPKPSAKPGTSVQNNKPGAPNQNKPSFGKPDISNQNKPNQSKPNAPNQNKPDIGENKPSGNKPSGDKPSGNKPSNGDIPESIKMELLNERDVLDVAAKPMTKEAALKNIKPYKFTLKNSGTVNFDANIKLNIKENTLKVNNRDVRVYITDNYGNIIMDGTFDQLLSKDIRISRFMDRSFNLWAWLDKPTSVKDGKFEFVMSALATQSMERGSN